MLSFLFEKTPLNFLIQSFWRDEAFSYLLAKRNILEILSLSVQDFSPPFYPLLLKLWMFVFGASEVALRSLSFVAYLLTFYFFYHFLTRIFKVNKNWAIVYSVFFFINPFLNYYAFEARAYSLFALFTIGSFYYFLTKKKTPYLVMTVLGLYTHYFMVFVPLIQALYVYLSRFASDEKKDWYKTIGKTFLWFAPWILFLLFKNRVADDSFWIERPNLKTLYRLPSILYLGFENNFGFFKSQVQKFSLFLYLLIGGTSFFAWRARKNRSLLVLLLVWVFAPALIVFLVSLFKPVFFPRYLILTVPGILLLLVFLLDHLPFKLKVFLLALLFFFTLRYDNLQVKNRRKAPVREVTREIKAQAQKNDLIYATDILEFHTLEYYLGEDRVFIFDKNYDEIPAYVGRVLIPPSKLAYILPLFPKRAFIVNSDLSYDIQAVY